MHKFTDSGIGTIDGEMIGFVGLNAGFDTRSKYLYFVRVQRLWHEHAERTFWYSDASVTDLYNMEIRQKR